MKQKFVFVICLTFFSISSCWLIASQPTYANPRLAVSSHPLRQASGPALTIPVGIMATTGATVTAPIDFRPNGSGVTSLAFSIDFDSTCLAFNATDNNGDFTPDAVQFTLPAALRGSATYDPTDTDSELDIVIADYNPPLATLPDTDQLVMITFTVLCTPPPNQTLTSLVNFSDAPLPSFGDIAGHDVNGTASGGTVLIANPAAATVTPPETPTLIVTSIVTPRSTTISPATATPPATTTPSPTPTINAPTNLNGAPEPIEQPVNIFLPWLMR